MKPLTILISIAVIIGSLPPNSYCQSRVTGHIFDDNGQPLPGVSVLVKGTTTGTTTDMQGAFSIPALATSTLVFSFIGYHTIEVQVKNRNYLTMELTPDVESTKFAALYVPSFSGLIIDDFAELHAITRSMTAGIKITFSDQTSKIGEAFLIGTNEGHLLFLSAVDLFYSAYDIPLRKIVIEFQGKRDIEGQLFLLPDTVHAMNPDLAIVAVNAMHFPPNTELLLSNRSSKTYFANLPQRSISLQLVKSNKAYEELYFETTENPALFLGSPVYNRYGVAGVIVDNIGQTLVATNTSRSLSMLKRRDILFGDTVDAFFNTYKYRKKVNFKKLKPVGLSLGSNFTLNFFNGADLVMKNSAFGPSFGVFAATNFLGFDLTYEVSYNQVDSKPLNASATYIRLRNTHYGHSILLEKSIFHLGGVVFSFSAALSHFRFSAVVFNSLEQRIPLEVALGQEIASTFKSFSFGSKIDFPAIFTPRLNIFSRILLVNTDTSHLDVNIVNPANSRTNDDMLLKVQVGWAYSLF